MKRLLIISTLFFIGCANQYEDAEVTHEYDHILELLLLLVLTLSVFTFAQSRETSYIYKNVITIQNGETSTFNTPLIVTGKQIGRAHV